MFNLLQVKQDLIAYLVEKTCSAVYEFSPKLSNDFKT